MNVVSLRSNRTAYARILLTFVTLMSMPSIAITNEQPVKPTQPAVQALVQQAAAYISAGQYAQSVTTLERALRIAPRHAQLWHYLAQSYLHLGEYEQVGTFASKSTSLAGKNEWLKAQNTWLISASQTGQAIVAQYQHASTLVGVDDRRDATPLIADQQPQVSANEHLASCFEPAIQPTLDQNELQSVCEQRIVQLNKLRKNDELEITSLTHQLHNEKTKREQLEAELFASHSKLSALQQRGSDVVDEHYHDVEDIVIEHYHEDHTSYPPNHIYIQHYDAVDYYY